MRRFTRPILIGLALLTAACRPPIGVTQGLTARRDAISRGEMIQAQSTDLYNAVQKLHPEWLTARGPVSMTDPTGTSMGEEMAVANVVMMGQTMGDIEYLRGVRPDDVDELRYFNAAEASSRFGMGHPRGVIEIIPRGQGGG